MYHWKKFQFFEDKTPGVQLLPETPGKITCTAGGHGQIVLGMADGNIHVVDRNLKLKSSWKAHGASVRRVSQLKELVLGRPEAVYFYEVEGKGPCWVFDGAKQCVAWFRGYLIVVASDARSPDKRAALNIYDLKNKLIVFSVPIGVVEEVVMEWGMIVIIVQGEKENERKVITLAEKDMGTKLEMLFKKNLYLVAINLVQSQNSADGAAVAEVMRKFGDHLYEKQDYEEAMAQYIRTIGYLEPSYVIQKFLDAQRINNLTLYLERLHSKGLATADHTTLLLNCYTKLKDVEKLDQFIKAEGEHRFDVETTVRVCRAAGYFEHAMYVAKRAGDHASYLRILLEDLRRYEEALEYISGLPPYQAALTLKQYGKLLVGARPKKTTEVLMKICMDGGSGGVSISKRGIEEGGSSADLLPKTRAISLDLREGELAETRQREEEPYVREEQLPSPMDFVHLFVDRPLWLMKFLEQYAQKAGELDSLAASEIKSMLLELYLCEGQLSIPALTQIESADKANLAAPVANGKEQVDERQGFEEDGEKRRQKALQLLKTGWAVPGQQPNYDVDLALVLCQMHNFEPGLLFLYERMHLYKEVMAVYMRAEDYQGLIDCCKKLADSGDGGDPRLWMDVMAYFGEKERDCENEVREVLKLVERDNVLPPLIVLQTLSKNPRITVGVVRDYVTRQINQQTQLIDADRRAIEKYEEETATMKAEIEELRTGAKVFQLTRCSRCTDPLHLPAVHFLCMHSFHQQCLGDNDRECPLCAASHATVMEAKRGALQSANDHDSFFQRLHNADDGFAVIAEYFGKGMLTRGSQREASAGGSNFPPGLTASPLQATLSGASSLSPASILI
ncbi:hypothetical protein CBR_g20017 [Chara braunii]|uniref:Vacuolar protein sorting-associated protein 11 homolog n=1 Tax=Chara braunii TaxID=69332 RepID=A0A388KZ99_CHABU|nr:hypothetical protein CBR_g20017 [Chara braunii]|eukprot:GBG75387.1 hypothetical protein CBR_g20017 [Chara braunii]